MTVLILHGIGGRAGIHWQGWLYDELIKRGHTVVMPSLPSSNHPDRQTWLGEVLEVMRKIDLGELIIVGHSLGVTTALDFLEVIDTPVKALVSVSGFAKDYGADFNGYFLRKKQINFDHVRGNIGQSTVIYGDHDPYVTQAALADLAAGLKVTPLIIPDGGHLNTESGYTEFPPLLKILLDIR